MQDQWRLPTEIVLRISRQRYIILFADWIAQSVKDGIKLFKRTFQ